MMLFSLLFFLALGRLTIFGFNSWCGKFVWVCNQLHRSTRPGHPSVGLMCTCQLLVMLNGWGVKAGVAPVSWQVKLCDPVYLVKLEWLPFCFITKHTCDRRSDRQLVVSTEESVCPSVCLSVCPSVGLSVCLSDCLSVCLSVCLSTRWSIKTWHCISVYNSRVS